MTAYTLIYDFIICILHHVILLRFFQAFFERRKTALYFVVIIVVIISAILTMVNQKHNIELNTIVSFLLAVCLNAVLYHGSMSKKILLSGLIIGVGACIEYFMIAIASAIMDAKLETIASSSEMQFTYSLINQIVFFMIISIVIGLFRKNNYTDKVGGVSGLILLPISSILAGMVMFYLDQWVPIGQVETNLIIATSCFILLISNLVGFKVYDKSMDRFILEAKNSMLERSYESQLKYFETTKKVMERMRAERHDFKHHLMVIENMLKSGNEKTTSYISQLIGSNNSASDRKLADANNPAVNAILMVVNDTCRKEEIKLEVSLEYDDLSFIDQLDAVALLANAFDNAIEACCRIPLANNERFISINVSRINDMLFILINNSYVGKILENDTELISSKKNPGQHGFGFYSMKDAANKYGGSVTYEYDEDTHVFSLMIRLEMARCERSMNMLQILKK